jgi:hypothetical protein
LLALDPQRRGNGIAQWAIVIALAGVEIGGNLAFVAIATNMRLVNPTEYINLASKTGV